MKRYQYNTSDEVLQLLDDYGNTNLLYLFMNGINPRIIDQELVNKIFDINYKYLIYIPFRYQTQEMVDKYIAPSNHVSSHYFDVTKINPKLLVKWHLNILIKLPNECEYISLKKDMNIPYTNVKFYKRID